MPGIDSIIVDADAIIGLSHQDDALHKRCLQVHKYLKENKIGVIVSPTTILEAATAVSRTPGLEGRNLAAKILQKYSTIVHDLSQENSTLLKITASLYSPQASKKDTPFDYYVLAAAKKLGISVVFSFDNFYKKHGLRLAEELL